MKATHNTIVDLTPEETGCMLASATPEEFIKIWEMFNHYAEGGKIKQIAQEWCANKTDGKSNGLNAFKRLITAIEYHEMGDK